MQLNCKPCPEGYTSEPGSVGLDSCISMRPCVLTDLLRTYSECRIENDSRSLSFSYLKPLSCNPKSPDSFKLPPTQNFSPCKRCLRGQYYNNEAKTCKYYCPDGTHSIVERYKGTGGNWNVEPSECRRCPDGKSAVKVYELEHFDAWPEFIQKKCLVFDTSLSSFSECEKVYGWIINEESIDTVSFNKFLTLLASRNQTRDAIQPNDDCFYS